MPSLFERAQKVLVGGVNSPVRMFAAVGGVPPFVVRGQGAFVWDQDEKAYVDYICSWGAVLLGHADPTTVEALSRAANRGLSFGMPTEHEVVLAEKLQQVMPAMEKIRLLSSGTEATMTAIRLARGYTQRDHIIKFEGCYHGHADALLVAAGSGALTFGRPDSAGVPESLARHTLVLPYNDAKALQKAFAEHGRTIAAVIVEPVAGNMNMVLPAKDFLDALHTESRRYGSILIVDEIMTGFRVALGGATALYHLEPDLLTLGKVIGGGMPLAALGGKKAIMDALAPLGPVNQAGTLSGNPVAVAAGLAVIDQLTPRFYTHLGEKSQQLAAGLTEAARQTGVPFCAQALGGMMGFYFSPMPPANLQEAKAMDTHRFKRFFHAMLDQGVLLPPSAVEACFITSAHGDKAIAERIE
jgi:glutamate-1-semialdehyde 2,1-aminomutase